MAIDLETWLLKCNYRGVPEDTALELHDFMLSHESHERAAPGSNPDRGQSEPVFVAIYCELTSLGRLQEMLARAADLRTRACGCYKAGAEFALWGTAPVLKARSGYDPSDCSRLQFSVSLCDELATAAEQIGVMATGGNRP